MGPMKEVGGGEGERVTKGFGEQERGTHDDRDQLNPIRTQRSLLRQRVASIEVVFLGRSLEVVLLLRERRGRLEGVQEGHGWCLSGQRWLGSREERARVGSFVSSSEGVKRADHVESWDSLSGRAGRPACLGVKTSLAASTSGGSEKESGNAGRRKTWDGCPPRRRRSEGSNSSFCKKVRRPTSRGDSSEPYGAVLAFPRPPPPLPSRRIPLPPARSGELRDAGTPARGRSSSVRGTVGPPSTVAEAEQLARSSSRPPAGLTLDAR
ncbi:hypothetical protein AAT19DRAFT_16803 [Rhodotorula toruloides]|uniref:Uncharacterized protein n=1 Tax=Rhodotorula toruloides TaxID=5286 RepID=A0A2T0A4D7_RHOTO|nr:hypothetical protein AAT19DRAFT_16803 [Rhodotorula toruloides]